MPDLYDVVIVGGGHNGLTAAAYLASAGQRVLLLERLEHVGGAAASEQPFAGIDAQLSRYSYLVSLLPDRIRRDLKLDITLARRRYSSYTPDPVTGRGLLIDNADPAATMAALGPDAAAWAAFYDGTARVARAIFPTMTEPVLTRAEARSALGDDRLWDSLIETPIGRTIADTFSSDVVRGVVMTDALIGTFAPAIDETMSANRCFLYHVMGNDTGNWDVPVGGMGAVTGELYRAARDAGASILTSAEVTSITPDGEVGYRHDDRDLVVGARFVLANVAPSVLARLVDPSADVQRPEGAQVKTNLVISRLPRLRDPAGDPQAAFGGTFHANETWSQLDAAYVAASSGSLPSPLPLEAYCHSLTDPSILSPELRGAGAQAIAVFGLQVPDRLVTDATNDARRAELQTAVLASLNSVLAEPIESLLLTDSDGRPAIETSTTRDLERRLTMPGGNIFHGPLSWPFAEDAGQLATPAGRWGVDSGFDRILLCGAGAQRGGGVSGIGGHNAAMAVLELS